MSESEVNQANLHKPTDSPLSTEETHQRKLPAEPFQTDGGRVAQYSDEPRSREGLVHKPELNQATELISDPETAAPCAADSEELPADQLGDIWKLLRGSIRQRVAPEQFETWFRRADLYAVNNERICIAVQNRFSQDWLNTYYKDVIEEAAQKVLSRKLRVEFSVDPELTISNPNVESAAEEFSALQQVESSDQAGDRQQPGLPATDGNSVGAPGIGTPFIPRKHGSVNPGTVGGLVRGSDVGLNPRYTFDNFVVGPCNRFCHAVSMGTAEAPGKTYNPLFLHGNVGLGKTHLLQSICFSLIENWSDVRILYLSCETFVNHFISALENGDVEKFRGKYRNVDVLVVDDIHLLANKERTQEEFFHTFNSLYNAGKQIILSSDSPPKEIPTLQARLVSRFDWGLVTELEPPCYETRMAILKRKGRGRGQELPDEVAQLIAERVDTNIRELEGTINKLYGFANVTSQAVTVELAREVLTDLFAKRRGQPSMDDIIEVVTSHFGVKLAELQSKKRTNQIAFPRQVAMFLARKITRHSLEEIGGFFGGRDHSTVLHAVRKIEKLAKDDEQSRDLIAGFLNDLQASGA
jgi:chromosomal replication initiator protein